MEKEKVKAVPFECTSNVNYFSIHLALLAHYWIKPKKKTAQEKMSSLLRFYMPAIMRDTTSVAETQSFKYTANAIKCAIDFIIAQPCFS